jgi:hypothetical protein
MAHLDFRSRDEATIICVSSGIFTSVWGSLFGSPRRFHRNR